MDVEYTYYRITIIDEKFNEKIATAEMKFSAISSH
jgi:hypothetical protein